MTHPPLRCDGCGASAPDITTQPYPFRCSDATARPEIDHVMGRPPLRPPIAIVADERNPFIRYRQFLHAYHVARQRGCSDAAWVGMVEQLDAAIARVDGRGFAETPLVRSPELEAAVGMDPAGAIWIKDETQNVSGSHKARHLMGVMLYLLVIERLGLDDPRRRRLAIASCGNAALAAAVVAHAAGYPLDVYVPESANPAVVSRIAALQAHVEICRRIGDAAGDPSYLRFRHALADGALPFCCQGPDNGLTIEGGETLALEIGSARGEAVADRMIVQVGGGALAASCLQGFADMQSLGSITRQPRFYTVQTSGAFPLKRAFERVAGRLCDRSDHAIDDAMSDARTHRAAYMWPWEDAPHSIAHGILDDETYDWARVVEGMLRTDGAPLVVAEDELTSANALARRTTGIDVDHTGSAGLAGLIQLLAADPTARREQLVVIFSGVRRAGD